MVPDFLFVPSKILPGNQRMPLTPSKVLPGHSQAKEKAIHRHSRWTLNGSVLVSYTQTTGGLALQ